MKQTVTDSVKPEEMFDLLIEMQKDYYRKDEILKALGEEERRYELKIYYLRARDFLLERVKLKKELK